MVPSLFVNVVSSTIDNEKVSLVVYIELLNRTRKDKGVYPFMSALLKQKTESRSINFWINIQRLCSFSFFSLPFGKITLMRKKYAWG